MKKKVFLKWGSILFSGLAATLHHKCCLTSSYPVLNPEGHLSLKMVILQTNSTSERGGERTAPCFIIIKHSQTYKGRASHLGWCGCYVLSYIRWLYHFELLQNAERVKDFSHVNCSRAIKILYFSKCCNTAVLKYSVTSKTPTSIMPQSTDVLSVKMYSFIFYTCLSTSGLWEPEAEPSWR